MKTIQVKLLSENAKTPTRGHYNDSGLDLYASEDVLIEPGKRAIVPTDVAIVLDDGYEAQVRPRSGVSSKTDLTVILGTVDAGYRGNIGVIVHNTAYTNKKLVDSVNNVDGTMSLVPKNCIEGSYLIRKGDKIAQMVVVPISLPEVELVDEFKEESSRGDSAFGSTGY